MDNKINDILENLDESIDLTNIYEKKEVKADNKTNNSTNDIKDDLDDVFL
ncbi:hypothetical protein ACFLY2_03535 [Patescibacteria group bacterium]